MYKFTMDFDPDHKVKSNFTSIFQLFGIPNTIVELGVFEGASTVWLSDTFSRFNNNLKIHAVDPHVGSQDLEEFDFSNIQRNFLHNIKSTKFSNIIYHNSTSTAALLSMTQEKISPEFIYVDGDHTAAQVLTDLVLSWQLLPKGGIILCDDATNWKYKNKQNVFLLQSCPKLAIDYFIHCNFEFLEILSLPSSHQVAFRKLI